MENLAFFGFPVIIGIIAAGFSLAVGMLLLILYLQKRRRIPDKSEKNIDQT